jgi:subtilisin family serine protease/subtilisin-like proprotein convertase family protein
MSEFFWQGGKKIEITQSESEVTIHAEDEQEARDLAATAGVKIGDVSKVAEGLVSAKISGHRDAEMKKLRGSAIVHHVYRSPVDTDQQYMITDSYYMKFKPGTKAKEIQRYLTDEGLEVVERMTGNTLLVRVTAATGRNCIKAANSASQRDDVEFAEPNLVHRLQKFSFIPSDPLFSSQWHLHAPDDATDLVRAAGIFAAEAWETTRGVRDITICVADDGFDLTHPDFQGDKKVSGSINVTASGTTGLSFDNDVSPRPGDYHGTPCAGVAVAEQNGTGTVGVAPGCSLLAARFPLNLTDAQMVKLFEHLSPLADVVSCSWGYGPANVPMSSPLRDSLTQLAATGGKRGKGLVVCVAAGNNNCPVRDPGNTRTYEYLDSSGIRRTYSGAIDRWIAAHPDVLTISACTSLKTRSCYSSWGTDIDVCAPSDNWDDMRRISPKGLGIFTTDNEGFGPGSDFTSGSRYTGDFGGTSSATPTTAGVCALVLSRNQNLTSAEVRDIIRTTADKDLKIASETAVNEPGDFVSGFSLWFGHGKINAAKAVAAAASSSASELIVDITSNPALSIPDNSSSVSDSIRVDDVGTISEIRVAVDIHHTYIGDLRVDLIAPDGTAVTLHNQTGGSQVNLTTTFSNSMISALNGFRGKPVQGVWTLRVSDHWRMDAGIVNSWRLVCKAVPAAANLSQSVAKVNRSRRRAVVS